ncbi:helix-turn-helix transcriptional regulator [Allosphingosinicella deserti]|nr:YafY family protein [Sphingomonas deserti]
MRRADRLLQIIQVLRRSHRPTTAQDLAAELEVTPRTIYRDMAVLQASRVPIDGEAGVGYVLRPGYDLPPLMLEGAEIDAVVLGLTMVIERGDPELALGARDALAKVEAVLPRTASHQVRSARLLIPHRLAPGVSFGQFTPAIRSAIHRSAKLSIAYVDLRENRTERTVWPLGLYLYSHVTLLCAWCEEREDFRAFRAERIDACEVLPTRFDGKHGGLLAEFLARFSNGHTPVEAGLPARGE